MEQLLGSTVHIIGGGRTKTYPFPGENRAPINSLPRPEQPLFRTVLSSTFRNIRPRNSIFPTHFSCERGLLNSRLALELVLGRVLGQGQKQHYSGALFDVIPRNCVLLLMSRSGTRIVLLLLPLLLLLARCSHGAPLNTF